MSEEFVGFGELPEKQQAVTSPIEPVVSELTELDIRLAIAKIEGECIEHTTKDGMIFVSSDMFSAYDPLNNNDLCFRLMVKHGIELKYTACPVGSGALYFANTPSRLSSDYCESPNRAICLAVIKAH